MSILSVSFFAIVMVAFIVLFIYGYIEKRIDDKYGVVIRNVLLSLFSLLLVFRSGKYELIFYICYLILVYCGGFWAEKGKKGMAIAVIVLTLPLLIVKYSGAIGINNVLFPIGISYVTFKSLAYIIDVYKGKCNKERNIIVLFSYILFFPELFIGPIDRTDNLLLQLRTKRLKGLEYSEFIVGINYILWGLLLKVVIADRIGIYVNIVYNQIYKKEGFEVLIAVLLYSIQIYLDFSGCTNIILGIGHLFGYTLPCNFKRPYLAKSVSDFWRRWHISLTNWLREYIYIPLGGSKKGTVKKYINIMIVFIISGIWHGSGLSFLIWGVLNGAYQVIGGLTIKRRNLLWEKIGFDPNSFIINQIRKVGVFILMTIAWVFFRAKSIEQAALVFRKIFSSWNPGILFDGTLYESGLNQRNWGIMIIFLIGVGIVDYLSEKGISWQQKYKESHFIVKGLIWYVLLALIIIFGIYGSGYDATQFIYENF